MNNRTNVTTETNMPESTWPTVRLYLLRHDEPKDSLFFQINRHCPISKGQRCLVVAPRDQAVSAFLMELRERIISMNPDVEARILRVATDGAVPEVDPLIEAAQSAIRQGRHMVLIVDTLNALVSSHPDSTHAWKRLFGTAMATKNDGTVTIIAIAVEPAKTESDVQVLRTFQGTGNMEISLRLGSAHELSLDESRSGTKHAGKTRHMM